MMPVSREGGETYGGETYGLTYGGKVIVYGSVASSSDKCKTRGKEERLLFIPYLLLSNAFHCPTLTSLRLCTFLGEMVLLAAFPDV